MSGGRRATRRSVLGGLSALALSACAAPRRVALGGGEGDGAAEPRGGIGGTGISPDATVGVIGTLTGFGSLRVNGLVLRTDARSAVSPHGEIALAPGHVVEAAAAETGAGLAARALAAEIALAGPVTRAPAREALQVAGVEVRLETGAPLPPGGAAIGDRVAVSGLWRGEVLVASRVDPAPPGAPDLVSGVARRGGDGALQVGGVALAEPGSVQPERYAVVSGRWAPGLGLAAEAVRLDRPILRAGLRRLSAEGYLVRDAAGGYAVSGLGAELDPGARIDRLSAGRAVFIGRLEGREGGRFRVEHGIPLPEGASSRSFALGRIGDGLAPSVGAVETR
ncbi:MAG: DUF5666 domain-containing protein [Pseudomonadota bacterium]